MALGKRENTEYTQNAFVKRKMIATFSPAFSLFAWEINWTTIFYINTMDAEVITIIIEAKGFSFLWLGCIIGNVRLSKIGSSIIMVCTRTKPFYMPFC